MSYYDSPVILYRCARCRLMKPSTQFQPFVERGTTIRSDSCDACRREIVALRSRKRVHDVTLR